MEFVSPQLRLEPYLSPEQRLKAEGDLQLLQAASTTVQEMGGLLLVTGGYAVDAYQGIVTREHGDTDGILLLPNVEKRNFRDAYDPTNIFLWEMARKLGEKFETQWFVVSSDSNFVQVVELGDSSRRLELHFDTLRAGDHFETRTLHTSEGQYNFSVQGIHEILALKLYLLTDLNKLQYLGGSPRRGDMLDALGIFLHAGFDREKCIASLAVFLNRLYELHNMNMAYERANEMVSAAMQLVGV